MKKFYFDHEAFQYVGRWAPLEFGMTATATGAYVAFGFVGYDAVLHFSTEQLREPVPHIYIEVDEGAAIESTILPHIRIRTKEATRHTVKMIFKGAVEAYARWCHPLESYISLLSVEADDVFALPKDLRKTIEFIGDSITEGVLIDETQTKSTSTSTSIHEQCNRPFQDDVTATYAYLTADALNLRPYFMGYGAVGITHGGQGGVPSAINSYDYCFEGAAVNYPSPDYILINHGANDRFSGAKDYIDGYSAFLDKVRTKHPGSKIIALSAFCGAHHEALGDLISAYNAEKRTDILFIDTAGWVPVEPLHPQRDGHRIIAEKLIPILKEHFLL